MHIHKDPVQGREGGNDKAVLFQEGQILGRMSNDSFHHLPLDLLQNNPHAAEAAELWNSTAGPCSGPHPQFCTFPPERSWRLNNPTDENSSMCAGKEAQTLSFVLCKGETETHGAVVWPLMYGSNSCKENSDFSLCGIFQIGFLGAVCSGGQRDSPIYSNHFSPFRKTFFQFDFKVVGNMLFPQTLYQTWNGRIWSGSIHEPGEPHGIRFMSVWTWVQLFQKSHYSSAVASLF